MKTTSPIDLSKHQVGSAWEKMLASSHKTGDVLTDDCNSIRK